MQLRVTLPADISNWNTQQKEVFLMGYYHSCCFNFTKIWPLSRPIIANLLVDCFNVPVSQSSYTAEQWVQCLMFTCYMKSNSDINL